MTEIKERQDKNRGPKKAIGGQRTPAPLPAESQAPRAVKQRPDLIQPLVARC